MNANIPITRLGTMNAPVARHTSTGTIPLTRKTRDVGGPPSIDVNFTLGHATANDLTNLDLGLTTTQQHDYQPIEMDVSWEQMQRSRLPVRMRSRYPWNVVKKPSDPAMDRETLKSLGLALVVDRETLKPPVQPQEEHLHRRHRLRRPDPAEVLTSSSVNDAHTGTPVLLRRTLRTGPTST